MYRLPTAHASLALLAHSPVNVVSGPRRKLASDDPFQCRSVCVPSSQTSSARPPQAAIRWPSSSFPNAVHAWPFQWATYPFSPTPQMSLAASPHSRRKPWWAGASIVVQLVPSQWMKSVGPRLLPMAQTSLSPLPQIVCSPSAPGTCTGDHSVPFQSNTSGWNVRVWPTAQTSSARLPQIEARSPVVDDGTVDHAIPFQCSIHPLQPTAQTSFGPLPQTCCSPALRALTSRQEGPSQCDS